ncbi:MAG TPA: gamma-glutamyl-gamma-aminobutyrate hydrolase family protein [Candidatus Dormibacteraeota bacterium]|jgi:gamma-glutamyl-gamma-aminobutyrate hydrolase PuuD|nr:gamma-glutamyl-gamma-aminobutyrate hydrolase family protein [Candidatus Dormibacteraeota bacterium]
MAIPMVGISCSADLVARSAGAGENSLKYAHLVAQAGLLPVLLMPGGGDVMSRLDGLLLAGGPDIAPWRYGSEPGADLGEVVPALDDHELELADRAQARGLPILGICRGQQLINVALGGTLHQHVSHPQWDGDPSLPAHRVEILAGTHLRRVLAVERAEVNSGHHQAVDRIAPPLRAAARSSDGLVEALEAEDLLIMAVQWHPEEMAGDAISQRLMAGFARWMES